MYPRGARGRNRGTPGLIGHGALGWPDVTWGDLGDCHIQLTESYCQSRQLVTGLGRKGAEFAVSPCEDLAIPHFPPARATHPNKKPKEEPSCASSRSPSLPLSSWLLSLRWVRRRMPRRRRSVSGSATAGAADAVASRIQSPHHPTHRFPKEEISCASSRSPLLPRSSWLLLLRWDRRPTPGPRRSVSGSATAGAA